jgi:hypothetical protein
MVFMRDVDFEGPLGFTVLGVEVSVLGAVERGPTDWALAGATESVENDARSAAARASDPAARLPIRLNRENEEAVDAFLWSIILSLRCNSLARSRMAAGRR